MDIVFSTALIAAAIALLVWAVALYNRLVRDRHRVLEAWSDIDVQLKRRHDLIPKLVEVVRRYAAYEQATLEAVTELRTRSRSEAAPAARGRLEGELTTELRRLIAVAENYPQLKASEQFLTLLQELSSVEEHIQFARRYYNGAVRNYNTRIQSLPDLAIARAMRYEAREYFELDAEDERGVPPI